MKTYFLRGVLIVCMLPALFLVLLMGLFSVLADLFDEGEDLFDDASDRYAKWAKKKLPDSIVGSFDRKV